jgi:AcrR family transcriptional regulator
MTNQKHASIHTRNDILNAAEKLFAENGFDGTGMMQISRTAGVPKSLIYYYFKSKEDILNELVDRLVRELIELKTKAAENEDPKNMLTGEGLRKLLDKMYSFYDRHSDMYRIVHQEGLKKDFVRNFLLNVQMSQQASIDYFKEAGMTVREKELKLSHFFLIAMPFMSFVVYKDIWCSFNDFDPDAARETFFDLIVDASALILSRTVSQ